MLGAEATPPARFRRTSGLFRLRLRLRSGFSDRLRRYFHDGFWLWCRFPLWRGLSVEYFVGPLKNNFLSLYPYVLVASGGGELRHSKCA